jgi:hypothetical protein
MAGVFCQRLYLFFLNKQNEEEVEVLTADQTLACFTKSPNDTYALFYKGLLAFFCA